MAVRIKFFFQNEEALATHEYLNGRGIRTFLRERSQADTVRDNGVPFGFDLFVLNDSEEAMALTAIEYEFGSDWGKSEAS